MKELKIIGLGASSSVLASLLLNILFEDVESKIMRTWQIFFGIVIVLLIILLFRSNFLKNYKYMKGVRVYWFNINKYNKKNQRIEFKKYFSPKIEKSSRRIICKLNTGESFFELFEESLINNSDIRYFNKFIFMFSTSKDYITILKKIKSKEALISKGKRIGFRYIEEKESLYTYIIVDDCLLLHLGGIMVEIDLSRCNDKIRAIVDRYNDYVISLSSEIQKIPK